MPTKKKRKLNPISAFLAKRLKQKKRKQFFNAIVGRENYEPFLKQIDTAITDLITEIPDSGLFLDKIGAETAHWLKDMPNINLASFKAGTCYGVYAYCRMKKEQEAKREQYIV